MIIKRCKTKCIKDIRRDMIQADIIITNLGSDDISIHFVTPDFYDKFKWSQDEIALSESENNKDKWKAAQNHRDRIDSISFENYHVLKTIYSQALTDGEEVNEEFKIGRILNL